MTDDSGSLEIEQFLEFLVERDTEDKRKLRRGVELSRFDRADGVSGYSRHLGKLCLRESPFFASRPQRVLKG